MNLHTYPIKMRENEGKLFSAKCVTNGSSSPDGLSDNLLSVTRTAAGKYTALLKTKYISPQILWMDDPTLVGAAGYDVYLTSIDKDSYATSAVTCDTKANTTDDDYFTLHDGVQQWTVVLDVAGDGSAVTTTGTTQIVVDVSGATTAADIVALLVTGIDATAIQITTLASGNDVNFTSESAGTKGNRGQQEVQSLTNAWAVTDMTGGIDGVYGFKFETWAQGGEEAAAAGTVKFDTKANTTTGDYFVINDGHKDYGFELNTTAATASHAINPVAATSTLVCGTGDQSANDGDYFILNDGQERYCFELDKDAGGATLVRGGDTVYGNCNSITVVNTSGSPSAIATAALVKTAIDSTDIQMTVVDNGDATLTLTQENVGPQGNTQQIEAVSNAAYTITDMTGGLAADVQADVWTVIDVSSGTTAADLGTLALAAINGTAIQITAADAATPSGTLTLTNDNYGTFGNTQSVLSETGATLLAVTDMTAGASGAALADTTDYDVYFLMLLRNSKLTFR